MILILPFREAIPEHEHGGWHGDEQRENWENELGRLPLICRSQEGAPSTWVAGQWKFVLEPDGFGTGCCDIALTFPLILLSLPSPRAIFATITAGEKIPNLETLPMRRLPRLTLRQEFGSSSSSPWRHRFGRIAYLRISCAALYRPRGRSTP